MGGVFFVPVAVVTALVSGFVVGEVKVLRLSEPCALGYAAIGWLDDGRFCSISPIRHLAPMERHCRSVLHCLSVAQNQSASITTIALPWDCSSLGITVWLLCVACGESNATNLTDGVDGLAAGTAAIALLGLGILVAPTTVGLILWPVSGGCLGFSS